MINNSRLSSNLITLLVITVLFIFSNTALGCNCDPPPCGECQTCVGGTCMSNCTYTRCETCVNGQCVTRCNSCSEQCVNGYCIPITPVLRINYVYDEVGNRTSMVDPTGTTSYVYDYLNRLTSVTNPDSKTISYQYDAAGNRIQLTDPASNITNYSYDDNNRLLEVSTPSGATTYQYNSTSGHLERVNYPNGTYTQYTYHSQRNWLVSLVNKDSTNTVLSSYTYTHDNAGNRLSVTENGGSAVSYVYDDIYQLTSETRTGANPYTITYQYDDAGNRTQMVKNGTTTTYAYNSNNQLTSETTNSITTTYTYDDNGNTLSKSGGGNTTTYTWGWGDRLLSVSEPGGTTAYVYDGDGTRVKKTQGSVITKYINDVGLGLVQVLLETTDAGIIQAAYTYGNDLISMNRSSVNSYYHYDGLGSARQLTDSSEAAVANYIYDAFGNSVASVSSVANTYGFTGEQQFNEADSLVFLRARYYSPNIGRFISRDPIGYRDGLNLYAYCKHNPINFTDPEGKAVNPHTIACAICAFMFGKDIAGLITDCLNAGNDCNGNKKSFWDCIKDNWHKAFIPESKWEKMLKSTSCGICFLGYKPFPIPGKPIPIPVPASAGF